MVPIIVAIVADEDRVQDRDNDSRLKRAFQATLDCAPERS
jgi:hypothetical protein